MKADESLPCDLCGHKLAYHRVGFIDGDLEQELERCSMCDCDDFRSDLFGEDGERLPLEAA